VFDASIASDPSRGLVLWSLFRMTVSSFPLVDRCIEGGPSTDSLARIPWFSTSHGPWVAVPHGGIPSPSTFSLVSFTLSRYLLREFVAADVERSQTLRFGVFRLGGGGICRVVEVRTFIDGRTP
jgi:hypothetical protein